MGAVEISGIGMAMIGQGVSFDAGATMTVVLFALLGVGAAAILSSRVLAGMWQGGVSAAARRPMRLSPAPALLR